jgi:signal transduction histidine kinase
MTVPEATTMATAAAARPTLDPSELASLVQSFSEVTSKLESTHASLRREVGALQDELAEAHARLERSRQLAALGEMAAGIAHELRNPLGCIALTVDALVDDLEGQEPQLKLCGRLSRAVVRLDGIVGDVLDFARDTRVRPQVNSFDGPVAAALANVADLVEQYGITVELAVEETVEAAFDPSLVEQAILNLVRNACEAMGEADAPTRTLSIGLEGCELADGNGILQDHVLLSVSDTGPGIPEPVRQRMFNPFYTTRVEGTGLGLAIVHRIVDAHGGRVMVIDCDPGTRIELALPRVFAGVPYDAKDNDQTVAGAVRRRVKESANRGAA